MTSMVSFSFCATRKIFIRGILFGLSDILLIINTALSVENGIKHVIDLGVYYAGIYIMADSLFAGERKTVAETAATPEEKTAPSEEK